MRAIVLVVAVGLAYNYSLMTLARALALDSPLAYLALVPFIALGLAWLRLASQPGFRPIHDRQLDFIVGFALIGAAAAGFGLLPAWLGTQFWLERIDLLGLPLFVAGLVSLLYGVRMLWALKVPIAFLVFAWPLPYQALLVDAIDRFADLTSSALVHLSAVLPFASPVPAGDGLFLVGHEPSAFVLSVGSACSGVNSLIGFVLVGAALAYIYHGPIVRRALWLAGGLAAIWALNVVRIEVLFAAGSMFGKPVALDLLHPVAGLIVFNVGVLAMLVVAPRLGLTLRGVGVVVPNSPLRIPSPVRRIRGALLVLAPIVVVFAVLNAGFARYEAIAGAFGDARLTGFDVREAQVPGWTAQFVAHFDDAGQFFGPAARWDRVLYASGSEASLRSSVPIYVDVISTADAGTFATYGLQACYTFHGYDVTSHGVSDFGSGVQAQWINYRNKQLNTDWSAVWWEWPFHQGTQTLYERIVVFVANGPKASYAGGTADHLDTGRFAATDSFLISLGRALVRSQVTKAASA